MRHLSITHSLVNIDLQLVKTVEEVDDDVFFTIAADKNRHKVQVYFNFDAQELNYGDTITVKNGLISQSGKVVNVTIERQEDIEVALQPLFSPAPKLGDVSWRGMASENGKLSPLGANSASSTPKRKPAAEAEGEADDGHRMRL